MAAYIVRRIAYGALVLLGVNLATFFLFFTVNTPDDMARLNIGGKRVNQEVIEQVEGRARLRQAAVLQRREAGHAQDHRHHLLGTLGVAVRAGLRPRRCRKRRRHRPRGGHAHVGQPAAGAAAVRAAADRQHGLRAAAGDVPPHPARLLGRGGLRADAVDQQPVLHHRRPVLLLARAQAGADLGLCGRLGRAQVPGAADRPVAAGAAGRRGAAVPRDVPRGNRQGLRAHGARQGPVGDRRAVPARAAQRADPDHHQRRQLPALCVPGQPGVRELLRPARAGRLRRSRPSPSRTSRWCAPWSSWARCCTSCPTS